MPRLVPQRAQQSASGSVPQLNGPVIRRTRQNPVVVERHGADRVRMLLQAHQQRSGGYVPQLDAHIGGRAGEHAVLAEREAIDSFGGNNFNGE